ncbi:MAG: hypothetical protein ACRDHG_04625 [Anaerolineales bacterium]
MKYRTYKTENGAERYRAVLATRWPDLDFQVVLAPRSFLWAVASVYTGHDGEQRFIYCA